jgi:DNA mismatch repair protein MSH4
MQESTATKRRHDPGELDFKQPPKTAARPYVIVALIENRTGECGLAVADLNALHNVQLTTFEENQTFQQTMALLQLLEPTEICVSESQMDRKLTQAVSARFSGEGAGRIQMTTVSRKWFDEVSGEALVKALAEDGTAALQPGGRAERSGRYLAFAALSALVKHIERVQHMAFAPHSLHVDWTGGKDRMSLDYGLVRDLEVLVSSRTGDAKASLMGTILQPRTGAGTRLLRSLLLSPTSNAATLEDRLDAVDALMAGDTAVLQISARLSALPDLDGLLSAFAYTPTVATPRTARAAVVAIIGLRHVLQTLPSIVDALEEGSSEGSALLAAICSNLRHAAETTGLVARIDEIIDEKTAYTRVGQQSRVEEAYAVRAGVSSELDAVRVEYSGAMGEMQELVAELKAQWECPTLKLNYSASRGWHLLFPAAVTPLPPGLVQGVTSKGGATTATTPALASLNDRVREALLNTYQHSNLVLTSLLVHIRHAMASLSRAVHSIALLDLTLAFAGTALKSPVALCRPTFGEGPSERTVIVAGRHPIVERMQAVPFVPNDCELGGGWGGLGSVLVLTGPNCSGKSTFLRQTALLHILSHVGAYVPARSAHFRVTNRICALLGTGDDLEANASTFLKEMRETAFALAHASDSSLVLLDELGRGSSNEDGVGVAWAVVEALATTSSTHALVTTHYHELTALAGCTPGVRNVSMAVDVEWEGEGEGGTATASAPLLRFSFAVEDTASARKMDYGLALAEMCNLPLEVVQDARRIKEGLASRLAVAGRPGTSILTGSGGGPLLPSRAGTAPPSTGSFASRDAHLRELMAMLAPIVTEGGGQDILVARLLELRSVVGGGMAAIGITAGVLPSQRGEEEGEGEADGWLAGRALPSKRPAPPIVVRPSPTARATPSSSVLPWAKVGRAAPPAPPAEGAGASTAPLFRQGIDLPARTGGWAGGTVAPIDAMGEEEEEEHVRAAMEDEEKDMQAPTDADAEMRAAMAAEEGMQMEEGLTEAVVARFASPALLLPSLPPAPKPPHHGHARELLPETPASAVALAPLAADAAAKGAAHGPPPPPAAAGDWMADMLMMME